MTDSAVGRGRMLIPEIFRRARRSGVGMLRKLGGPVLGRLRRPTLSIVLTVADDNEHPVELLDSIFSQGNDRIEVLILDRRVSHNSNSPWEKVSHGSVHLRVLNGEGLSVLQCLAKGVLAARGQYLGLPDEDGRYAKGALGAACDLLARTTSDMLSMSIGCFDENGWWKTVWPSGIHDRDIMGFSAPEVPQIMADVRLCNKFIRTHFLRQQFVEQPSLIDFNSSERLVVRCLVQADSIDAVASVGFECRAGSEPVSHRLPKSWLDELNSRIRDLQGARDEILSEFGSRGSIIDAWKTARLRDPVQRYIARSMRMTDREFYQLQTLVHTILSGSDILDVEGLLPSERTLVYLVLFGDRKMLETYVLDGGKSEARWEKAVCAERDDLVKVNLPLPHGLEPQISERLRELCVADTRCELVIDRSYWNTSGDLVVDGGIWFQHFAPLVVGETCLLNAYILDEGKDLRIRAATSSRFSSRLEELSVDETQRPLSGFRLVFSGNEVESLVGAAASSLIDRSFPLEVEAKIGKSVVTVRTAAASGLPSLASRSDVRSGNVSVFLEWSRTGVGRLCAMRRGCVAIDGRVAGGRLHLQLRVFDMRFRPVRLIALRKDGRPVVVEVVPSATSEYLWQAILDMGLFALGQAALSVEEADGRRVGVFAGERLLQRLRMNEPERLALQIGPRGGLAVVGRAHESFLSGVVAAPGITPRLLLETEPGLSTRGSDSCGGRLWDGRRLLEAQDLPASRGFSVSLSQAGVFGLANDFVAPGKYLIVGQRSNRSTSGSTETALLETLVPTEELALRMPFEVAGDGWRVQISREAAGVFLRPVPPEPLSQRSRSRLAQKRAGFRAQQVVPRKAFFQCMNGSLPSDSPRAIAGEIWRQNKSWQVSWAVSDCSIPVPAGSRKVVVGTTEWYDELGSAELVCVNHELPDFFIRKRNQTVVQTFHGHPFKSMGIPRWRHLGVRDAEIARNLERRNAWTHLVAPSPLAQALYREAFPIDYEMITVGYPRNDELALAQTRLREVGMRRLGLQPNRGVRLVLYAPTYRDYETKDPWSSKMVEFFDPDELANALGPDYVLLLRGHPIHRRLGGNRGSSGSVIDVSRYPYVNELIALADIGVFDYSSIRFDFLLSDKPMVYFVPDLAQYFSAMPSMIPFDTTIAGPVASGFDELVSLLRQTWAMAGEFKQDRHLLKSRFTPFDDGHAAARVVERLGVV